MAGAGRTNSGRALQKEWSIPAHHVLYHYHGVWYHVLERFPGALCDPNGYVLFDTREDFLKCPDLKIGVHVKVPRGVSTIPGYVKKR